MEEKLCPSAEKSTSRDLLSVTGDGSSRAVVESLLRPQPQTARSDAAKTFQIGRSPLLDQLQSFLPAIQRSNQQLLAQSKEELEGYDIENIDEDDEVVEMNVVMGEMNSEEEAADTNIDCEDSEDDGPILGPVTTDNLKIPSEARRGKKRGKDLIAEISDTTEESECDRSEDEMTVASSSSAER